MIRPLKQSTSDVNRRAPRPDGEHCGSVRLAFAFAAIQLGLHAWFAVTAGDRRLWIPHAVAWLLDLLVLVVVVAVTWAVGRAVHCCGVLQRVWLFGSYVAVFLVGVSLASYPGLLAEFLAFPTNVFRADAGSGWFFVSQYLGWTGLWPLAVSAMTSVLASYIPWHVPRRKILVAIAAPIMVLSTLVLMGPVPQPLVYSVQDVMRGWLIGNSRVVPSLSTPTRVPSDGTSSSVEGTQRRDSAALEFDHVVILVLEGVTTSRFEREFLSRPNGYWAKMRDRSAYFDGYHTTNLDSYTSLITMVTSIQVPYRAYADPRSYEAVNDAPNLVATLRNCGFQTLYISTSEHHPFIPVRKCWDSIMLMRDLPQQDGWVKVSGSKVEVGLEDRAATAAILEFVSSHPKTLVMHELLFGHSPRWMAKTGKSQAEYDDEYLLEITRGLEQKKLLDRTLLVVVSDHGDRAESANVVNYGVPLLVSGRGIRPSRSSALYSHKDFQQIVLGFLAHQDFPRGRETVVTVGSTERWIYGEIRSNKSYVFIDNDTGAAIAAEGTMDAGSLYDRFQRELNAFAARFQR
jgi:hypothetical protein